MRSSVRAAYRLISAGPRFQQRVAMLAVQSVIPRSLGLVDVREIIRFRKKHEDELGACRLAAVDEVATD